MTGTSHDGIWQYRVLHGLIVQATRRTPTGSAVVAYLRLRIDPGGEGIQLRVFSVTIDYDIEGAARPSATDVVPPKDEVERWANEPENALKLLNIREESTTMRLLGVDDRGKRPDWFYYGVLVARRECERQGLPYAETIANYNDVEPGTVYRWINEAKRRGIELEEPEPVTRQRQRATELMEARLRRRIEQSGGTEHDAEEDNT